MEVSAWNLLRADLETIVNLLWLNLDKILVTLKKYKPRHKTPHKMHFSLSARNEPIVRVPTFESVHNSLTYHLFSLTICFYSNGSGIIIE